jgi:glycosyltransferase involved in cell wall biosynthesis
VGRPIIFAINSRNNPVADAGAGLSVAAESPQALADAIISLTQMPHELRSEMGSRGREFVLNEFDYAGIARRLETLF